MFIINWVSSVDLLITTEMQNISKGRLNFLLKVVTGVWNTYCAVYSIVWCIVMSQVSNNSGYFITNDFGSILRMRDLYNILMTIRTFANININMDFFLRDIFHYIQAIWTSRTQQTFLKQLIKIKILDTDFSDKFYLNLYIYFRLCF